MSFYSSFLAFNIMYMENEEFELVDNLESTETNESDTNSPEIDVEEDDNNTSSQKSKNESNFKALYRSNKEKEKALAEKEALIAEQTRELNEWRNLNPDYVEQTQAKKFDDRDVKIFKLENPEAKEHLEAIKELAVEYGSLDKAWRIVKAELPRESKSTNDFDFKSEPVKVKKTLAEITPEQALKLPKDQLAKWQIFHGYANE